MLSAVELFSRVMKLLWPWNSSNRSFFEDSIPDTSNSFHFGMGTQQIKIKSHKIVCHIRASRMGERKYIFNYIFVHCLISPHRHCHCHTHRKQNNNQSRKKSHRKTFRDCRLMSRGRERPAIAWLIIINSKVDWEMAFEPENELNNC